MLDDHITWYMMDWWSYAFLELSLVSSPDEHLFHRNRSDTELPRDFLVISDISLCDQSPFERLTSLRAHD